MIVKAEDKFETWTMLVPTQSDGGGEWCDPEFRGIFATEKDAIEAASNWAKTHKGFATVGKFIGTKDIRASVDIKIAEVNN